MPNTQGSLLSRLISAGAQIIGRKPAEPPGRAEFRARVHREARRITQEIRAKYDAAQTTDENRKHWRLADDLSANAANSFEVRQRLRRRTRYERDNNSYCFGIVATLAGDMVGTGPRLQLMTPDEAFNRRLEREFGFWSDASDFAGKLNIADMARHVDGEGFNLLTTNDKLPTDVKLDLLDIEADQVTTPGFNPLDPLAIDGIRFDRNRNPIEYHVLQTHPGDFGSAAANWNFKPVAAKNILHWFTPSRPGQLRGVPTLTPALSLFAQLRRYTLAVLIAAEIAAELAAFIQSNLPPGDEDNEGDPFELLEIVRGQITTLPRGWAVSQLNPSQPTTGFGEFCNQILKEIARCLQMPWGLAAGDSSAYNYASGRLDVQTYQRKIKVERARFERKILDKVFAAWLDEARLIPGYIPSNLPPYQKWSWAWHWDGFEHVDPSKEASALQTLLSMSATTLEAIYAAKGLDWRQAVEQLAIEKKEFERLGLTPAATSPAPPIPAAKPDPQESTVADASKT